jgi:hypothetical protein
VTDLDGDGRPDFVALISQEHEAVVAFLNRGGLRFEPHELYRAPHPAWGSSGLELVDLDGDGDLDILVTNGDSSDLLPKLRPYHGITWLENVGAGANGSVTGVPQFVPHPLLPMYGVHRAEAADLDGDGDLDIVACSFIPLLRATGEATGLELESIQWLEQTEPGHFVHHSLERNHFDHASLALGDYDLDGDIDIAVGNYIFEQFSTTERRPWVELWENRRK